MKVDRLLEIVIYLLNHESSTAKQLADRFGVSVRTIQRDMDSISLAGVPLAAISGSGGGYSIDPDYRIHNQFVKKEDFSLIVMALKGLKTGYASDRLDATLDRYLALRGEGGSRVFLDYGVAREDAVAQANNALIEKAIAVSLELLFDYRNKEGVVSRKTVHPLALRFKWYAWYLFAWDPRKEGYRTYKVTRMRNLEVASTTFRHHGDVEKLLLEYDKAYLATCEDIDVWCRWDAISTLEEYFPEEKVEPLSDGNYLMRMRVPPHERLWQALLLSMGDAVRVIKPDSYRQRLADTAAKFLSLNDTQVS